MNDFDHELEALVCAEESRYGDSTANVFSPDLKGNGQIDLGRNRNLAQAFKDVHQFVDELKKTTGPVYELSGMGRQIFVGSTPLSPFVKALAMLCGYTPPSWVELGDNLKIAHQAIQSLVPQVFTCPHDYTVYYDKINAEVINEMADWIRQLLRQPAAIKAARDRTAKARAQFQSIYSYIDWLYTKYKRLLVLRFDLTYKDHTTVEQAKADLKRLLDNRRWKVSLFSPMVGYIARMEYGVDKGIHFHVFFFFNGDDVWKDAWLVERLGKYWRETVTHGRGTHFNCNWKKHEYENCGIGMIKRHDQVTRENLMGAVSYLTKDQYLNFTPDCGRVFFRGEIDTCP